MYDFVIISDLSADEEEVLYANMPRDKYKYIKAADMDFDSYQPLLDNELCVGIAKSNTTINLLESHDIAVLGYESTDDEILTTAYVAEELSVIERSDLSLVYSRFHQVPLYILETDRCIIREHTISDQDAIQDIYKDESMTRYIAPLYEPIEEREYLGDYIEYVYKLYGYGLWLVIDKESLEVIGRAGVELRENCEDGSQVELAYQVKKEYQGQGIATEVCSAIVDYTFRTLKKESIVARIDKDNIASIRVVDKLGLVPEGDLYIITRKVWQDRLRKGHA